MADYTIEHWTTGQTKPNGEKKEVVSISVNNRAATRQAIIKRVNQSGMNFVERSDWAAHKKRPERMHDDWNYYQNRNPPCRPELYLRSRSITIAGHSGHANAAQIGANGRHWIPLCLRLFWQRF